MPFGLFGSNSQSKLSKKKTYSLRHSTDESAQSGVFRPRSATMGSRDNRRHSSPPVPAPTGILKKSGRAKPASFPALAEGMLPQEMAAAVPMPNETELNLMFAQLVVSLYLHTPKSRICTLCRAQGITVTAKT